jgi:hypothetical protein
VIVGVTVGIRVRVGGTVEVPGAGALVVTESGSGVVGSAVCVWVCPKVGKRVGVRSFRFVRKEVGVFVGRSEEGTVPACVGVAKI